MWILTLVVISTGAALSYWQDSLVPGIICAVIALCIWGAQLLLGGDQ